MTTDTATIEQYARQARDCDITGNTVARDALLDRIRELLNPGSTDRPCDVCELCTGQAGCDGWN